MPWLRGARIVDLPSKALPRARTALARQVVARPRLRRGAFELHDDGRVSYALPTGWIEISCLAQAIGVAAAVSVTASLLANWMVHWALGVGALVGIGWFVIRLAQERRRLHRDARTLIRELPSLLEGRK